ncbi:MAG TPA: nucleoside triphosphate pyrophosphohydrolase [Candidatus Acidoferrales bacterium]|nr:nucleoside triphosphate pyrophosphohydrolase [Candidatus Acidoferrales bacterium]
MSENFDRLVALLEKLRSPGGCPWDREQTHDSLKPNLLEEAYEVLEAIDRGDAGRLREELGDLLLQVVFHAQIAAEDKRFTIEDVIARLNEKLVRRHPHVFGDMKSDEKPRTAAAVLAQWEVLKQNERQEKKQAGSVLDGVAVSLPALLRALQIQERAARVGFDWPDAGGVIQKVEEECRELRAAARQKPAADGSEKRRVEEEFGDLLFALVNLARFLAVNPEDALRRAIARFIERFHYIEERARQAGKELRELTLEQMDAWWNEAKEAQRPQPAKPSR